MYQPLFPTEKALTTDVLWVYSLPVFQRVLSTPYHLLILDDCDIFLIVYPVFSLCLRLLLFLSFLISYFLLSGLSSQEPACLQRYIQAEPALNVRLNEIIS